MKSQLIVYKAHLIFKALKWFKKHKMPDIKSLALYGLKRKRLAQRKQVLKLIIPKYPIQHHSAPTFQEPTWPIGYCTQVPHIHFLDL